METQRTVPVPDAGASSAWNGGGQPPVSAHPKRRRWLLVVLLVCVLLVGGGVYQLVARNAARNLYGAQVNTTLRRVSDEEFSQLHMKVANRSASAFRDLTASINRDPVLNPRGTLRVSVVAGSVVQPIQAVFSVKVASPYATTTAVVWSIYTGNTTDGGACVLSSNLLGPGRARSQLNLAHNMFLPPCQSSLWAPGPVTATKVRFGLAGIPR
jgi:hypothetical protein